MDDFFDFTDGNTNDFSNLTPGDIGVTDPGFDNGAFTGGSGADNPYVPAGQGDQGGGGTGQDQAGGAGTDVPPTQADYQNLVKQFGPTAANQIMQSVASANPNWASQIGQLVGSGAKAATSGGTSGGSAGGSGSGLGTTDPMGLAAAAALAYQQFHNADQYTSQAEKYAGTLNPYGAYRDAAAQKLAALQADPSSVVDTPGYKFALSQGLGAVANRDNRSFGVGAGSTNPDMMNYAQGLASKTYNDTINQYSNQAGVGIGPSAAAAILGQGMQGNIASQNNAINALMSPFGPGNNTGGGGSGGMDWSKLFGGGANAAGNIDWNSILGNANGGGGSTGTQNTQQTQDPNLPPSNGSYGSYTGGA